MLFATLDTLIRETEISEGFRVLFTDTIGFIRDLPPALIYAFHSTLEEILDSWLILHVVDSSEENFRKKIEVVEETLKELGYEDIPRLLVFNKMDKLNPDSANFIKNAYKEAVFISALRKEGLEDLKKKIHEILEKSLIKVKLFIPYEAGSILSQIYDLTNVIWKQDEENGTTLYIEGFLENVNRFKDYFVFK
jgi:GTP-binding protein HflX